MALDFLSRNKKKILIFAVILGIIYTLYVLNMERFMTNQDIYVYGQNKLSSGSDAGLRIVTLNHATGQPLAGADVTVSARDKAGRTEVLFQGKSSGEGTPDVSFRVPEDLAGDYDLVVTAKSSSGTDTVVRPVKIEKEYRILVSADKPLYQPGQTMHIRALSLGNSDMKPVQGKDVLFEVEDSKGNKVFKKKVVSSEYGISAVNFTLATELNLGLYTVRATMDGYSQEKKVEVKKYVLPKYKVDLQTDRTFYLPGEKLTGKVTASYFFGKPVNDADVTVRLYTYEVDMEQVGTVYGKTDDNGVYSFDYTLPDYFVGLPLEQGSSLLFFNVSVVDQAEHEEAAVKSVPVSQYPIDIELIPESGDLVPDIENIVYVLTTYPDGSPVSCAVTIKGQSINTNSYGIGQVTVRPDNFITTISASAKDSKGNSAERTVQFPKDYVLNPQTDEEWRRNERYNRARYQTENILLRVDRSIMDVGDTIHVDVFSTKQSGTVYVDVIRDKQTMLTKAVDIEDNRASLDIDADESMAGAVEIHAYKILANSEIIRDTRTVIVHNRRDIELSIAPGKKSYLPGEPMEITFRASKDNRGVQSAIGVNIVDESVFALQEKEAGFEKLYFELEQEFMAPRYEIEGITLPEIITGNSTFMADDVRLQAGNIIMANAMPEDRFNIKVSSYADREKQVQKAKQDYMKNLGKALSWGVMLIPVLMLLTTVYYSRKEKKKLGKELFLGTLLMAAVYLAVAAAFWFFSYSQYHFDYRIRELLMSAEAIAFSAIFIALIIASRYARRKNNFALMVIAGVLQPLAAFMLSIPLAEVLHIQSIVAIALPVYLIYLWISSIVRLYRQGKAGDSLLMKIVGLYIAYSVIFVCLVFVALTSMDGKTAMWIGLSCLLIPVVLGKEAVALLKTRNRLAVSAILLAVLFIIPSLGVFLLAGMQSFRKGGDMMMDRGMALNAAPGMMIEKTAFGGNIIVEEQADMVPSVAGSAGATETEKPRVRNFFPETLYSNPQVITDENGVAEIGLDAADSITTWRITALANTMQGEIGSANAGLLVFQEFFADIDLPVSLTQNDEISIPVAVYNYLREEQSVRLVLEKQPWFELEGGSEKTISLGPNDIGVVYFTIKAKRIGTNKLTVYAYGSAKSDAISRQVDVVPDGKEMLVSYSDRLEGTVEKTVTMPPESIPGSEKLFVKIYPGIFSQVVEGLDSMFGMPSGCFEQTSSTTYPNILVMDYMKSTNQITPEIQFKAEEYIGTGYQRLMAYESNTPGGWTWFGPPEEANLALSIYGLMEFYDMDRVYSIDKAVVTRTQNYVVSQMSPDGSFEPEGRLHTTGLDVVGNKMTSTCFAAYSLAYTGYKNLGKTEDYILGNIDLKEDDSYTLAMCANAIALIDRKKSIGILQELDSRAVKEQKTVHWESGSDDVKTMYGGHGGMKTAETTALAALAYMEAGYGGADINKILTYIVNEKNGQGNWGSTFATILSLKALLKAIGGTADSTNARVDIYADNALVKSLTINSDNSDVMQLVDLRQYARQGTTPVKIVMAGEGNLFYQVVAGYYVPWKDRPPEQDELIEITVRYDKTGLKVSDTVNVDVHAVYNGPGFVNSGIIDLGIPPGFSVDSSSLEKDVEQGIIRKYDITGKQIIIYLQHLDQKGISIDYSIKAKYPLKAKTPKSAVYDYYNPDVRAEVQPMEIVVE